MMDANRLTSCSTLPLETNGIFFYFFLNFLIGGPQDIHNPLLNPPVVSQVVGWLLGNLGFFLFTKKWYWHFSLFFFFFLFLQFWTDPSHKCHFWNNFSKSLQWGGRYQLTAKKVTSRITGHLLYCRAVTNRVRILVRCNSSLLMSYRHLNTAPPKWWFKAPLLNYTSNATSIINRCSISREHEHYAASITRIAFKWQQRRICWFSTHSI